MAVATAIPRAGEAARPMSSAEKRVIFASSLGTVFEWYDFYLYGSLAGIIGAQFFSAYPPATRDIFALLAFAAGFLVRPFGAIVFGRVGDIVGRKYTFLVTILIMGLSTFIVGLLPSYASIGIAAPVILILLRLLQGLALGGEYGGAATYVAEHAPHGKRGPKAKKGPKLFTVEDVRALLGAAKQPLRAMMLLALNCGFGNSDVGSLPESALDLQRGWVDFPRPKTGIAARSRPASYSTCRKALSRHSNATTWRTCSACTPRATRSRAGSRPGHSTSSAAAPIRRSLPMRWPSRPRSIFSIHAPIGLRNILREWTPWRSRGGHRLGRSYRSRWRSCRTSGRCGGSGHPRRRSRWQSRTPGDGPVRRSSAGRRARARPRTCWQ